MYGDKRDDAQHDSSEERGASASFGGVSWRFGCRLARFGDRAVLLSRVSDPRTVIPAVYRLLGCMPAVLPARLTKAAYERRLRELAAPLQRLPTRTDLTDEQIVRRALLEFHRVAMQLRTVHPPFAAQRAHDDFAYAYEQAVDLKTITMQAFLGDGTGGTPGERLAERRLSATARAALARARRYFAAHDYDVDLRIPRIGVRELASSSRPFRVGCARRAYRTEVLGQFGADGVDVPSLVTLVRTRFQLLPGERRFRAMLTR